MNMPSTEKKRVLVIDDEKYIVDLLYEYLSPIGYDVETATNGDEAKIKIVAHKFDAIICDIKMPGVSGMELYEYVTERHPDMANRVIFITGDSMATETSKFLKTFTVKYIRKPFNLSEIYETIKNITGGDERCNIVE